MEKWLVMGRGEVAGYGPWKRSTDVKPCGTKFSSTGMRFRVTSYHSGFEAKGFGSRV